MVFSSIEFLWLFMPLVLVAYLAVPPRWRNPLLVAASLLFYVWGAHGLLFLFVASIGVNYLAGRMIGRLHDAGRDRDARVVTAVGIGLNVASLVFWKYTAFAVVQLGFARPSIALPIGISFFTFHGISYLVDVRRSTSRPMRHVVDYAQYMAFFPQLIAGPIIRYHQIDDQIREPPPRSQRLDDFADGFPRFALGLSKKVLIADQVGPIADAAFAHGAALNSTTAWLGALAYTVQLYFDFSGYSDMAIGLGRMFGFRFPENFNRPYSSVSMTDFWRRWHMTLSRFFRDYVYIPLGGNRGSTAQTVRNLLFVFALTGVWHGANWTFLLWGLYNGGLIVAERLSGVARLPDDRSAAPRRAGTFVLVVLGWVLFRSNGLADAGHFYREMAALDFGGVTPAVDLAATTQAKLALAVGLLTVLFPRNLVLGRVVQDRWAGAPVLLRGAVIAVLPWAAITVLAGSFSPFLYFQF